ncbi:hypothetical protein, partial [Proteus mirabilis]|uniref:hypothetical protein n=1 Tax=Proteus mirabilis TaxID=584 RepID=UPI0039C316BD
SLAQSVEQLTFNQLVGRSSRPRPTISIYFSGLLSHAILSKNDVYSFFMFTTRVTQIENVNR